MGSVGGQTGHSGTWISHAVSAVLDCPDMELGVSRTSILFQSACSCGMSRRSLKPSLVMATVHDLSIIINGRIWKKTT